MGRVYFRPRFPKTGASRSRDEILRIGGQQSRNSLLKKVIKPQWLSIFITETIDFWKFWELEDTGLILFNGGTDLRD